LTRLRSAQHLALRAALVEMREATNLNQRDFATRLGRDKSFIWRMEVRERRAQVVELIEISWAACFSPPSVIQRIQSRGPLVPRAESRIEIPIASRLRTFMARKLIDEIVKARGAAEQSKRRLRAEIGRWCGMNVSTDTARCSGARCNRLAAHSRRFAPSRSRAGSNRPAAVVPRRQSAQGMCAAAHRRRPSIRRSIQPDKSTESHMYIGGILGTILIIALIVYFVRRV